VLPETGYNIDLSSTSILDKLTGCMDCMIREVVEISLHPLTGTEA
jgi:hypothetical protein